MSNRIPLITYELDTCQHCLKCIRACPTEAISRAGQELIIAQEKCIGCGKCVEVCEKHGLKVDNSHMSETMDQYDFTIALLPGSFFADFSSLEEAGRMMQAIKNLGFDEVLDYSDIEAALYLKTIDIAEQSDELKIASFCPVVNELVRLHFPMLLDNLVPLAYPVEVAARLAREKYKDKGKVGIYSLCECIAKKRLGKEPFDNPDSAVDHVMSFSHIFPKANRNKDDTALDVNISRVGITSVVSDFYHYYQKERPVVSVSGIASCMKALELAEFGHIDEIGLLGLFACEGGCIGGRYLWTNSLVGRLHMDKLAASAHKKTPDLPDELLFKDDETRVVEDVSFKEKMQRFKRINEILESLAQFDCGACGYPSCRALAEAIADGKMYASACRVKREGGNTNGTV